jgi:integrase/recombinase XerC
LSVIVDYISFLQHVKKYALSTIISYQNDIEQLEVFIQREFECDKVEEANHLMIRSWVVYMTKEGVSARSINRKLSSLNGFFKYVIKNDLSKINPLKKVVPPKMKKKLPSFVIEREMEEVAAPKIIVDNVFRLKRNSLIIDLLYQTGMRRSELINLTIDQVNFARKEIRVIGKGKKVRAIPIQDSLALLIGNYLGVRAEEFESANDYLILSNKGVKMNPKVIYNIVNDYLQIVNSSDKKSPHVLRHTFATHLLNNGADINAIKEILGHANLAATQVYTHNSVDRLIKIYKNAHPKAKRT